MLKFVSLWYKWYEKDKAFSFNHLSDYTKSKIPIPISEIQKVAWKDQRWKKKLGVMYKRKVYHL